MSPRGEDGGQLAPRVGHHLAGHFAGRMTVIAQERVVHRTVSRRWLAGLVSGLALLLPSCTNDGHVSLFGYTSHPPYDLSIATVRVPIFKNLSFRRGLEFDLTRAVVREIESKTPYKVVSGDCPADTELSGTIINLTKAL